MFSYVTNTNQFPKPLKEEEEKEYIKRYFEGDLLARNILIEHNLRLVAHIVKKYKNYDSEELISVGTIGLIKGINSFNSKKGTRLATYVARCIENEILMLLRQNKKHIKDVYLQNTIGTDKDGNEVTLQDKIADEDNSIDEQVDLKMQIIKLYENLNSVLTEREKNIIEMRYGIITGEEITQREVAKLLGISRSYVSRIEKKALNKLKNNFEKTDAP